MNKILLTLATTALLVPAMASADLVHFYDYKSGSVTDAITGAGANAIYVDTATDRFGSASDAFLFKRSTVPVGTTGRTENGSRIHSDITLGPTSTFSIWARHDGYIYTGDSLFSTGYTSSTVSGGNLYTSGGSTRTFSWNTGDGHGNAFSNLMPEPGYGSFQHYVVVRDGVAQQMRLYIDGVSYGSAAYKYDPNSTRFTVGNLFTRDDFGDSTYSSYNWNGVIDDVAIYNVALDESQIMSLYNTTRLSGMLLDYETSPFSGNIGVSNISVPGTMFFSLAAMGLFVVRKRGKS